MLLLNLPDAHTNIKGIHNAAHVTTASAHAPKPNTGSSTLGRISPTWHGFSNNNTSHFPLDQFNWFLDYKYIFFFKCYTSLVYILNLDLKENKTTKQQRVVEACSQRKFMMSICSRLGPVGAQTTCNLTFSL